MDISNCLPEISNLILYNNSKCFYSTASNSPKDNLNFSANYKNGLDLNQEQREALIGIILSDGHLARPKSTHNTRLRIEHTYPAQESYVLFLYNMYANLVKKAPSLVTRKPHAVTGKRYESIKFSTVALPCLNLYHGIFYANQKKKIPANIAELITFRGLAHFIMGDGYFILPDRVIMLCTENFSKQDLDLLIEALDKKLGIKAGLNVRKRGAVNTYRVRIRKESMDRLIINVKPYFTPEMLYKLGL